MLLSSATGCNGLSESAFASAVLGVAASRTMEELGEACHREIGRLIGSRSIGLYLLDTKRPRLLFSRQAAPGFLQEYDSASDRDVIIDQLCDLRRPLDGFTAMGAVAWHKSGSFDLLRRWGYRHCMAGPLSVDGRVVGVLYTANAGLDPYGAISLQRMDILCRAGSLALANMMESEADLRMPADCPKAIDHDGARNTDISAMTQLPRRSREVAELVALGRSNKEIARGLGLSVHTVKEYVGNLCKRMGVQNRTELAHRFFQLR